MEERKRKHRKRAGKKAHSGNFLSSYLKRTDRKVTLVYAFLFLLFFILSVRMVQLQVFRSEELTKSALALESDKRATTRRGVIYDAKGNALVGNISRSDIYVDTKTLSASAEAEKATERLMKVSASLLDMEKSEVQARLDKGGHVLLKRGVERTVATEVRDSDIPGVVVEDYETRTYPGNDLASLVLGFVNRDGEGQYGLERYYDDSLRGVVGKNLAPQGKDKKNRDSAKAAVGGADLTLTLSESLQRKTEEILDAHRTKNKAERITAIVQETDTGAIATMASTDDYNLNKPYDPADAAQRSVWKDLTRKQKTEIWFDNWRNFAVSDMYEPGSTFKTVTAAAALEENTSDPKKHYYCTGYVRDIPGITITCTSLPDPHGDITMDTAFAESCNVTFVSMARELGEEGMLKYIRAFGFGEKTGIDLPAEQAGLVPEGVKDINAARLATMSFGHGIAVTPIQMVTAVSAVANGGYLLEPYVVREIRDAGGNVIEKRDRTVRRQVISSATSETMLRLLQKVVEEGTGTLGAVDRYHIGGKTGTADKVSAMGGYEKDKYISSFVAVGPTEDPAYTVLVIVENPKGDYYGATVAAPIASEIMGAALREAEVPMLSEGATKKKKKIVVPDVENMLLEDAGKLLTDSGLKFNMSSEDVGNFGIVEKQMPKAGTEVDEDTIVDLSVDPNDAGKKRVPKLQGKTKEQVKLLLDKAGIDYAFEGEGTVVSQEPLGGEVLGDQKKVYIRLEKDLKEEKDEKSASDSKQKTDTKDGASDAQKKAKAKQKETQ